MFFGTIIAIISTIMLLLNSEAIKLSEYSETVLIQTMYLACAFSTGFLNIVVICHIADNVTKNYRGSIATNIPIGIYGLSFFADIKCFDVIIFDTLALVPVITIVLSVIGIVLTYSFTYDPVTYLLQFNGRTKAEQVFQHSNKDSAAPTDLQSEIDEIIKATQEEINSGLRCYLNVFSIGNWKPLATISLLFILQMLGFKIVIKIILQNRTDEMVSTTYLVINTAVLVLSKFLIDKIGRKPLFWISGLGLIIASFVRVSQGGYSDDESTKLKIFLPCLANASLWLGITPLTYVYLCESFPLTKRNMSMAFVAIVNLGLFKILPWIVIVENVWCSTLTMLVLVAFVGCSLPETKRLSLRQSRNRCNNFWQFMQPYPTAPQWTV